MSTGKEKDVFKHAKGSFDRLTTSNYTSWSKNMRRLLKSLRAWNIVAGDEEEPAAPAANASEKVTQKYKDYLDRKDDAALCIYNACSTSVRVHIYDIDDPAEMWDKLAERLDAARTAVGRQGIYQKFLAMKPAAGFPIGEYFSDLLELRNQLSGTPDEISDTAFRVHIFNTMPPVFEVTLKFQDKPMASIETIMDVLMEDERLRAMRNQPDAAATKKLYCDFCHTSTHNTDKCWSKNSKKNRGRNQKNSNGKREKSFSEDEADGDDSDTCYYCGESGHRVPQCPIKKKAIDMRQKRAKKTDKWHC
jgi:hypothetical protein